MSKKLQMSLKTKWFEMTKRGEKTEDYREITPYWNKRLLNPRNHKVTIIPRTLESFLRDVEERGFKPFTQNIMTLGYPSKNDKERILTLEHNGIEIREGRPEWGAEPEKIYFVIKHGKIIE
jgi:hypothetical protein